MLRYAKDCAGGEATEFEDALRLARAITSRELRSLKVTSFVEGSVSGHSVLPILASDSLIVGSNGRVGDAGAGESGSDEAIVLNYKLIAEKRGLFPPAIAVALVDSTVEIARVEKNGGGQVYATGDDLKELRESGDVLTDDVLAGAGTPLVLDAKQLRDAKIAASILDTTSDVAELLDLAEINSVDEAQVLGEANGVLLEIAGAISHSRVQRWQSNLDATLAAGDVNTWIISVDSSGGDFDESAALAGVFASPTPPLRRVAGLVQGEARGDSALIAVACKPLLMRSEATIGGQGQDTVSKDDLQRYEELIRQIAVNTRRPRSLIEGLLCSELEVYKYTNERTGGIRYDTEDSLVEGVEDPELERAKWQRGELIDFSDGLTAQRAIELGLADGRSDSLEDVSRRMGLAATPDPVADRAIVRWVERLGRSKGLMFLIMVIGFIALSSEANAPGLGVPGFIALVCFGLYFWMSYLAGTAEWLELVLFTLGLICIAIEVVVIPGFGVFGIGGLAMTVVSIVLMSQTFVIPTNSYQVVVLTKGLWTAIGGMTGLFGGFLVMRWLFPHVPLFNALVMEGPDASVNETERLADFSQLVGKHGNTTTPLRPSGKARFGDQIVQVVSDGTMVERGVEIKVIEVHGTRVVVEPLEDVS